MTKKINFSTLSALLIVVCGIFYTSCKKKDIVPDAKVATSIELVSGDAQSATIETALTNPVVVIVKDQNGDAFAGTEVSFVATEGSVSNATVTTDAYGKATVNWTLGSTVGEQTLAVTAFKAEGITPLSGSPLTVSATAVLGVVRFAHGGVVFYILQAGDAGYDANVQHGLVCAVSDQSTNAEWGCIGTTTGADGTAIGTGLQNTIDIEAGCTTSGTAADICANLTLNSHSDWFLPSRDELNLMYQNKAEINTLATNNGGSNFATDYYWSSTEYDETYVWTQNFSSGNLYFFYKLNNGRVRAVRAF